MLTKKDKAEIVKNLKEELKKNKLAVLCNFKGISVEKQRDLKKKFREENGRLFVVKRRLIQRILSEEKVEAPEIKGSLMVGIVNDEIAPAKIIYSFPREKKEKIDFVGGIASEKNNFRFLDREEVEELAKIPSREELTARLVGVFQAPISNFQFVLKGNIQKLTYILSSINR